MTDTPVLVFYQYDGRAPVPQLMTDLFPATGRNQKAVELKLRLDKLVDVENRNADTILKHFQDKIKDYDHVLAVVTHDHRFASMAGNIWFEIGYWLALKGRDGIIIAREDSEYTKTPSDLGGLLTITVKSADHLLEQVHSHISRPDVAVRQSQHNSIIKIKETIHGTREWDPAEFAHCTGVGHDVKRCERVTPTLRMIAEITRYCESSAELGALLDNLKAIYEASGLILAQQTNHYAGVEILMDGIQERIEELATTVGKWTRCRAEAISWDKRLLSFLTHRKFANKTAVAFSDILKNLSGNVITDSNWYQTGSYNKNTSDAELQKSLATARRLSSELIDHLRQYMRTHWQHVEGQMRCHLDEFTPSEVAGKLDACANGFGHDNDSGTTSRIWSKLDPVETDNANH